MVAVASVRCPRCGTDIPCPTATTPTDQGLSVALDTTLVQEHVDMHARCTCVWDVAIETIDPRCEVHGG